MIHGVLYSYITVLSGLTSTYVDTRIENFLNTIEVSNFEYLHFGILTNFFILAIIKRYA